MARYRRVLKIDNGGGKYIFRTVRIESRSRNNAFIVTRFNALQLKFAKDYDTRNMFVDPRIGQNIPGYFTQQPGEVWDWVDPPP